MTIYEMTQAQVDSVLNRKYEPSAMDTGRGQLQAVIATARELETLVEGAHEHMVSNVLWAHYDNQDLARKQLSEVNKVLEELLSELKTEKEFSRREWMADVVVIN